VKRLQKENKPVCILFSIFTAMEEVILVDQNDVPRGSMEKLEAHQKGELHRAFSVFIFTTDGELLLQKRALHKYHSAGLWTNTCCSHPRPNETTLEAANRRLQEEVGISAPLVHRTAFVYKSEFENGLIEHEYDHVFVGVSDADPEINEEEVDELRYATIDQIKKEIAEKPALFTTWFKIAMGELF
jgi:isopentenyl-diphosphate delta-isomerase